MATDAKGGISQPMLLELPDQIHTARLTLRPPRAGDGPEMNRAIADERNERSFRVAERLAFELDEILRNDERPPGGELRDTRVYAKTSPG